MKKKKIEKEKTEEPTPVYGEASGKDTLRFFTSFEEMNEFDLTEMANSSIHIRFQNILILINSIFSKELQVPLEDKTIKFK